MPGVRDGAPPYTPRVKRCLELGSGALALMRKGEDFVLTLMKPKKHDPVSYPETFHVGFYVDDVAAARHRRERRGI